MKKEDKNRLIETLTEELNASNVFYLADISNLNAEQTSNLRRLCFNRNVRLKVVKNTLLRKAMDKVEKDVDELTEVLTGPTSVMFAEVGNVPAKLIKDFRKKGDKPRLKGAFIDESIYLGDEQLEMLSNIKSKEELIADVIALLQSPAKNVMAALQSGSNILTGVLTTLSERSE